MRWCGVVRWSMLCAVVLWPQLGNAAGGRRPATAILIEASSGQVLREQDADVPRRVGSFGQLMVLLLSLEQSELGALPLNVPVAVSAPAVHSPRQRGSAGHADPPAGGVLALRSDRTYRLADLVKAVAVSAADEAAIAVAEAVAGSVPAYVELMNARAERLGMSATRYRSLGQASTLQGQEPDSTSARDLAHLAQALVGHPDVLQWASISGLPFDDGTAVLRNPNQLIGAVAGVDGLQVTSTRAGAGWASHGIVATGERAGLRLIAVVLDAPDSPTRYSTAADLIEWGFAHYERVELVRQGERLNLPVNVDGGATTQVTPVAGGTFAVLRRRDEDRDLQLHYQLPSALSAPIERDQPIGEIIVEEQGQVLAVIPVLSGSSVPVTGVLAALNQKILDPASR